MGLTKFSISRSFATTLPVASVTSFSALQRLKKLLTSNKDRLDTFSNELANDVTNLSKGMSLVCCTVSLSPAQYQNAPQPPTPSCSEEEKKCKVGFNSYL